MFIEEVDSKRSFEDGGVWTVITCIQSSTPQSCNKLQASSSSHEEHLECFSAYLSSRGEAMELKLQAFSLLRWRYTGRFHTACKLPLQRKRVLAIELSFVNLEGEAQSVVVVAVVRVVAAAIRRTTVLLIAEPTAPAEHAVFSAAGSFGVILRR